MSTRVGGWTLGGALGHGRLGPLFLATAGGGWTVCVRRLDPRLLRPPGARDRALDLVRRMAASRHPGVVPVVDLVEVGEDWYLVTEPMPGPPLRELLDSESHATRLGPWSGDPASAVAIAGDLARTCAALHAAGLAHGSLSPATVLLDAGARARLAEPGLLAALTGTPLDEPADRRALADVVASMRRAWVPAPHPLGAALDRFADRVGGERGGADLRRLTADLERAAADHSPGWEGRPRLHAAVALWAISRPALTTAVAAGAGERDAMAATILDLPGADTVPAARTLLEVPGAPTSPPVADTPGRVRIGSPPGFVGPSTSALAGDGAAAEPPMPDWSTPAPPPPRRRRWRRPMAVVLGALAVILALLVALGRGSGGGQLAIVSVQVTVQPARATCGQQMSVVGVIGTNGQPGDIRYQWQRNDGSAAGAVHDQVVESGQRTVEVPLAWTITGSGTFTAVARLTILDPPGLQPVTGGFDYRC